MKFLVITRPNGNSHSVEASKSSATNLAATLRQLQSDGVIEASYAFIGGGSAYVVNADTAKQLGVLVRSNPLFSSQNHEIIPVADAHDFLDGLAEFL
jgi:hypothetical protein